MHPDTKRAADLHLDAVAAQVKALQRGMVAEARGQAVRRAVFHLTVGHAQHLCRGGCLAP